MTEDRLPGIVTRYPVPAEWSRDFKTFYEINRFIAPRYYITFIFRQVYIEGPFSNKEF